MPSSSFQFRAGAPAFLPGITWRLVMLALLCLLPRAAMAFKLDVICPDGSFYIRLATALERGDLAEGLGKLHLNTYPPILSGLHACGIEWSLAGRLWGVLAATLVVFPLYGWRRRLFDERVAFFACLVYAAHPKLIEWSPELIRDQTYWLCLTATVYAAARALETAGWQWFLASGATLALAVQTRFEGWSLLVPLAWWWSRAWWENTAPRRKLVTGAAACLATGPILVVLINVTWLAELPRWDLGNFQRLQYVLLWAGCIDQVSDPEQSLPPGPPPPPAGSENDWHSSAALLALAPSALPDIPRLESAALAGEFLNTIRRGLGPLFLVLLTAGAIATWPRGGWWRFFPLGLYSICVLAGMWVHLWYAQESSSRYVLSVVILCAPYAAVGLLQCADLWNRTFQGWKILGSGHAVQVMTLVMLGLGWADALTSHYQPRRRDAALGRWVQTELGPGARILATGNLSLVAHYANGLLEPLPVDADPPHVLERMQATHPQAVILARNRTGAGLCSQVLEQADELGYGQVAEGRLPQACQTDELLVLVPAPVAPVPATDAPVGGQP